MRISRPGLPTVYVDEAPPSPTVTPAPTAAAPRPVLTLEMERALADARTARLTRKVPGTVTQSASDPVPTPAAVAEPDASATVSSAPTEAPVQPKPVARPRPTPGKIPEHLQTGGGQPRTTPNSAKH